MTVDKRVIRDFWRKRAETGQTRWTGEGMLDFDQRLLGPLIGPAARILDLGSGFCELSRSVCPAKGSLVAVEQEGAMVSAFADDPRFAFVNSNIVNFESQAEFDVVLLFGVVTHLTVAEENVAYGVSVKSLAPGGVAVVKNQCSDGADFEVSTFSEGLGTAYVGRYPAIENQLGRLAARFETVEVIPYPAELKMHADSTHVAFICRGTR